MSTADKQRRLLRMALKMARAPSEEGAGAALETAVRAAAGRKNPAKIRAAVSQAIRHARGHAAGILNAASFTALYNKPVSRGPWAAWGVRAPPRLLQGRRPRGGACVGAAGGGAATASFPARGRIQQRRRRGRERRQQRQRQRQQRRRKSPPQRNGAGLRRGFVGAVGRGAAAGATPCAAAPPGGLPTNAALPGGVDPKKLFWSGTPGPAGVSCEDAELPWRE
jgi:hypothetical protein